MRALKWILLVIGIIFLVVFINGIITHDYRDFRSFVPVMILVWAGYFVVRHRSKRNGSGGSGAGRACPNSEYLDNDYWCDLGSRRLRISHLSVAYGDIRPDHAERVCKGAYRSCPLFMAKRLSR